MPFRPSLSLRRSQSTRREFCKAQFVQDSPHIEPSSHLSKLEHPQESFLKRGDQDHITHLRTRARETHSSLSPHRLLCWPGRSSSLVLTGQRRCKSGIGRARREGK